MKKQIFPKEHWFLAHFSYEIRKNVAIVSTFRLRVRMSGCPFVRTRTFICIIWLNGRLGIWGTIWMIPTPIGIIPTRSESFRSWSELFRNFFFESFPIFFRMRIWDENLGWETRDENLGWESGIRNSGWETGMRILDEKLAWEIGMRILYEKLGWEFWMRNWGENFGWETGVRILDEKLGWEFWMRNWMRNWDENFGWETGVRILDEKLGWEIGMRKILD